MEEKPKSKGLIGKLKEECDTHEERLEMLSVLIRVAILIWSGGIITLNYVELPFLKKAETAGDITFVAAVFSGATATFGLSTSNGKAPNGTPVNCPMLNKKKEE